MSQENLLEKYEITKEQYDNAVDILAKNLGKIVDIRVVVAMADLLASGDIKRGRIAL